MVVIVDPTLDVVAPAIVAVAMTVQVFDVP
jgi:hypothetical protein